MISSLAFLLGCFIIALVVFGGAQVFIPYYKILMVNILKISQDDWNSILSIANSTPGVFGLKVATASGYLAAENNWYAYLTMIAGYLVFVLVPIILILAIMKKYKKIKTNKFMISFLKLMKPVIAGILVSIAINLTMSLIFPFVGFNDLSDDFGKLDKYIYLQSTYFSHWRFWALLVWSIVAIPVDFILIKKTKINIIYLIIIQIILSMLLFQPWLN